MNEKQFAFIICIEQEFYYQECLKYIDDLYVPEGYSVDIISIHDADNITCAFNAGTEASEAKYKIYMDEKIFLINRHFLEDILNIFMQDIQVGMISTVGFQGNDIPTEYKKQWNTGRNIIYNGRNTADYNKNLITKENAEVDIAIGGLIATQYDIGWSENSVDKAFDLTASLKVKEEGYRIIVPYQNQAWCYCNYDMFTDNTDNLEEGSVRNSMARLFEARAYGELQDVADDFKDICFDDIQIREMMNLMEIYFLEKTNKEGTQSEWWEFCNWQQIYEYYNLIRFILLRFILSNENTEREQLEQLVNNGRISEDAILKIASLSLERTDEIYNIFNRELENRPLVSVVVSVYNGEHFIRETLESILKQTYSNMEIIVIDDASTDASKEIINSFHDERIKKVFAEKNRNVCYAGNVGFQYARGKYVALIGHDDIWREDKLEKQVSFLEKHPTFAVCFTGVDIIDEKKMCVNDLYAGLCERFDADNRCQNAWIRKLFRSGNFFCAASACIRKDVLSKIGYYRYGLVQLQDYDLWLRILCESAVYILKEKLTYYRRFSEQGKNLSSVSMQTMNRDRHEIQWIQSDCMKRIPLKKFGKIFEKELRNESAKSEKELMCERAFYIWNSGNCFAEEYFMDILEDEECREILEEKYNFKLNDFYKLNTQARFFDTEALQYIKTLEQTLEHYKKMV